MIIQSLIYAQIYIRPTAQEQKNSEQCTSWLYEMQPAGLARRLATQQVGYD